MEAINPTTISRQMGRPRQDKHSPCQDGVFSHKTQCAQVTKSKYTPWAMQKMDDKKEQVLNSTQHATPLKAVTKMCDMVTKRESACQHEISRLLDPCSTSLLCKLVVVHSTNTKETCSHSTTDSALRPRFPMVAVLKKKKT